MSKRIIIIITSLSFLFTVLGCATIISGRSQNLPIRSVPSGAVVTVGGQKQMTPATFILDKRQEYVVRVEKEGYRSVEVALRKGISGWVFGNILLGIIGGPIGLIIDLASGSASKFTPGKIEVDLVKQLRGIGIKDTGEKTMLFIKEKGEPEPKEETKIEEETEVKEGPPKAIEGIQPKVSSYAEYYRLLHRNISDAVVRPEGSGSGTINAAFTLLSDGTLEDVRILDSSVENEALRAAVVKAIKDSAPFPAFPPDMKRKREETFTITLEFRYR